MFTRFGINNNWDEVAYWDDFRTWWGVVPETAIVTEPLHPFGHVPQLAALQHGTDGYYAAQDTYIVTSNWEPPTLHDTFPVLYVRTNSAEPEIMSSLIGFDNISLPYSAFPVHATLSLYYLGQSVNGGDITVHVAGVEPEWIASQTTWTHYRSGYPWQIPGAKGALDRTAPTVSRTLNYTEVGSWLHFDVIPLVQQGYTSFILYASFAGVNKNVYFPSNEYWDTSKRSRLTIGYD